MDGWNTFSLPFGIAMLVSGARCIHKKLIRPRNTLPIISFASSEVIELRRSKPCGKGRDWLVAGGGLRGQVPGGWLYHFMVFQPMWEDEDFLNFSLGKIWLKAKITELSLGKMGKTSAWTKSPKIIQCKIFQIMSFRLNTLPVIRWNLHILSVYPILSHHLEGPIHFLYTSQVLKDLFQQSEYYWY